MESGDSREYISVTDVTNRVFKPGDYLPVLNKEEYSKSSFVVEQVLSEKGHHPVYLVKEMYTIQEESEPIEKQYLVVKIVSFKSNTDERRDFISKRLEEEKEALKIHFKDKGAARYIIPIKDTFELENGDVALVFPYLEGGDLRARLTERGSGFPVEIVASIGERIALALQELHDAGYIHRDVKPANIFCSDKERVDNCFLADTGLAKKFNAEVELEDGVDVIGTPAYISYEQYMNEPVPQSDLCSLGASLYHLRTGRLPYRDAGARQIFVAMDMGAPPESVKKHLPEGQYTMVDEIIMQLLKKDLEERSSIKLSDGSTHSLRTGLEVAKALEYAREKIENKSRG